MPRGRSNRHGRRPGGRRPGRDGGPTPHGFTGPGYSQVQSMLMPGLAGAEKRAYYNRLSGWVVVAAALVGAGVGHAILGWFGGLLGLGAGISAGGTFVERRRFYRR